jgi:hypothetical protein
VQCDSDKDKIGDKKATKYFKAALLFFGKLTSLILKACFNVALNFQFGTIAFPLTLSNMSLFEKKSVKKNIFE